MSRSFLGRSRRWRTRRSNSVQHLTAKRSSPARRLIFEALENRRVLAAPLVDAGADASLAEGVVFAQAGSFSDSDSQAWTARVDYGDGTGPQSLTLNSDKSFQLNHVYADNGNFTVNVTVTDGQQELGGDRVLVTVQNVVPNLFVRGRRTVAEGTPFTVTDIGMFTDPGFDNPAGGSVERFTYGINWGDGSGPDTGDATVDVMGGAGKVTRGTFDGTHTYTNVGQFKVALTVTDDDNGSSVTRMMTILAENAAPEITAVSLDKTTIDEGETVVLTGSFTDFGSDETHTVVVSWGDGETSNAVIDPVTQTFTAEHSYTENPTSDPPQYVIDVTVRDSAGGSAVESLMVTVNNAPPAAEAGAGVTTTEGESVAFSGSFTDAGALDTHTILWDFGDGSNVTGTLTPTHVYADNGTYTVRLTVTDDEGLSHADTLTATIANVAPTLIVPGPQTTDEGSTLTLAQVGTFTDPGFSSTSAGTSETFTYSINWGDGTASSTGMATITQAGSAGAPTAGSFDGSHVYADDGIYTATVTVTDDDGGTTSETFQVTVNNVAPTLGVSGDQQVTAGIPLNITDIGVFTDPGFGNALNIGGEVAETFTYSINWGDGTEPVTGAAIIDQVGSAGVPTGGSWDGSHTYSQAGSYIATVRITDDNGGFEEQEFEVLVVAATAQGASEASASFEGSEFIPTQFAMSSSVLGPVALADDAAAEEEPENEPPILFGPGDLSIDEGLFTMIDLGVFFDFDSMGPFEYRIDWGDGTAVTTGTATIDLAGPPTDGSFDGSHVFLVEGVFDLALSVTDEQGGATTEVFEVTVNDVAASLENVAIDSPINEGGIATLTGDMVDPGVGDAHRLVVDWGDGNIETFEYEAGITSFELMHRYENNQADDAPYTVRVELTDADQASPPAIVDLSVIVRNVAPTAVNDIYVHIDGGVLTVDAAHGVLANDMDPGTDTLTAIEYSTPSTGTLVGNPDGSFSYTPPSDSFSGIVNFTYKAQDSDGAVSVTAATVTVDSALQGSITGVVRATRLHGTSGVGIPGVTVTLTEATSQDLVKITTLTGDDGSYRFGGLRAGTYTVTETSPEAFVAGGADSIQVVLAGNDAWTGIDFVEGWINPRLVSVRNFLASGSMFNESLAPSSIRQLVARGEERAGHFSQAAAIRVGGSQTTVFISGSEDADQIQFIAGANHHKVTLNDRLPFVFVASEVEAINIDGRGGNDTARLVGSASADVFRLRPVSEPSTLELPGYSMQSSAYRVTVAQVERVSAEGGGGYDRAFLFDSPGDDRLSYGDSTARLTFAGSDDLWVEAVDIDWVRASGAAGGQNSAQATSAIDFVLETEGPWNNLP
ncbi:MAG: PKD domain-containing protein [Pirellulaceae bacterium]